MVRKHLVIPDVQVRPGNDFTFLTHIGQYIVDKKPEVIVCLGDFADMPSLSSYDKGKKGYEGRRYSADIAATRSAMSHLFKPIQHYNESRRRNHKSQYLPELHMCLGNHENRIDRAIDCDHNLLDGVISIDDLRYKSYGWNIHPFLDAVDIDGILYSHYFPRNAQGRITQSYRGAPSAILQAKREMQSCTSGHLQGLDFAILHTNNRRVYGLIAGSCYEHEEDYLTPQGTAYWRGIIMKHEVENGEYDPMFVSLRYLRQRYG